MTLARAILLVYSGKCSAAYTFLRPRAFTQVATFLFSPNKAFAPISLYREGGSQSTTSQLASSLSTNQLSAVGNNSDERVRCLAYERWIDILLLLYGIIGANVIFLDVIICSITYLVLLTDSHEGRQLCCFDHTYDSNRGN